MDRNGDAARDEGWNWMEAFFRQPKAKLAYHLTIFGTPDECVDRLRGYVKSGLTALIVRIASDDPAEQTRLIFEELRPRLT